MRKFRKAGFTKSVTMQLSAEEYFLLDTISARQGIRVSSYAREVLIKALRELVKKENAE